MKQSKWNQLFARACTKKVMSEILLEVAVRALMDEKGFEKEAVMHFSACFAGGSDTVINFCGDGEFADLSIREASRMTKEKIISRLSPYLSDTIKDELK